MSANYASGSIGYDLSFELNEFGEPRIRSEVEVLKNTILFILFTKPGQYPSLPQIGMNLEQKLYSFYDELDESSLQAELIQQCNALGMYFQNGCIAVKKVYYQNKPSLIIQVSGLEQYPAGYKKGANTSTTTYLIGITLDDLNQMIFNVNAQSDPS